MSVWSVLAAPFGSIVDGVGKYFTERQIIKAEQYTRRDELRSKELDAKIVSARNKEDSAIYQDDNARSMAGYMDDISFYLFLTPVPLSFFPNMVPHIIAGFDALSTMPEAYQVALGLMLVQVWGYKRLVLPIVEVAVATWAKKMSIKKKEP
tara:strand:- start:878 stop:1330 length:453 start_codon:yes stop_codon:yes gene_type:complete